MNFKAIIDTIAKTALTDTVSVSDIHIIEEQGVNVTDKMVELGVGADRDEVLEKVAHGDVKHSMFPTFVANSLP